MKRYLSQFLPLTIFSILLVSIALFPSWMLPVAKAQSSASPDFNAIDAYVQSELKAIRMPGAALGIVEGDRLLHLQAFGVADPSGRAVTPQTPFIIGSLSKSFTALAIMQLVEAGKLDLDLPVQHYLPWFRLADPTASAAITVRNLLNQTSGLPGLTGFMTILNNDESDRALEAHVRDLSTVKLAHPVGSTYEYCNCNYDILGLIVQVVSGESYETYIQSQIFAPLDMRQSFTSRVDAIPHGLADGYQHMFGLPVPREWPYPRAMLPSGFLISSAEDMAHYMIAQLNSGRYGGQSILSPDGIATMQKGVTPIGAGESYAMGWVTVTLNGVQVIAHEGDTYNYHSSIYLVPGKNLGLVLLMNGSNYLEFARMSQIAGNATAMLVGQSQAANQPGNSFLLITEFYRNSLVFALLLGLVMIGTARRLRLWRVKPESRPQNKVILFAWLVLPILFFLWVMWLFWFSLPKAMGGLPLKTLMTIRPDLTGTAIVLGLIALGWGIFYGVAAVRSFASPLKPVTAEAAETA